MISVLSPDTRTKHKVKQEKHDFRVADTNILSLFVMAFNVYMRHETLR